MDSPSSTTQLKQSNSVIKTLRFPFSGMLKARKERAAAEKQQRYHDSQAVEMLDFTASTSSYHRKTHSDSSVGTQDSHEGL